MIPTFLQDDIVEKLKNLFSEYRSFNVEEVELNIYPQYLPAKLNQKDLTHYPFILVRLENGEDDGEENSTRITFMIGIYNDKDTYQGHKDVINILQKIYQFLATKRYISNCEVKFPISWTFNDDDTYPFYFGGLDTNWICGKVIQDQNLI